MEENICNVLLCQTIYVLSYDTPTSADLGFIIRPTALSCFCQTGSFLPGLCHQWPIPLYLHFLWVILHEACVFTKPVSHSWPTYLSLYYNVRTLDLFADNIRLPASCAIPWDACVDVREFFHRSSAAGQESEGKGNSHPTKTIPAIHSHTLNDHQTKYNTDELMFIIYGIVWPAERKKESVLLCVDFLSNVNYSTDFSTLQCISICFADTPAHYPLIVTTTTWILGNLAIGLSSAEKAWHLSRRL